MHNTILEANNYDFKAKPKAKLPVTKYRQTEMEVALDEHYLFSRNLMYDPQVVRGNTYAILSNQNRNIDPQIVKNSTARQNLKKIRPLTVQTERKTGFEENDQVSTPPPVRGRLHIGVQTDDYIEILSDKLKEKECEVQTDFYIDRPMDRLFTPKKHGVDNWSQIIKDDPDLFNFDEECEPLINVLQSKIFEQARMEVLEEAELAIMKAQKIDYEQKVAAYQSEMQRLDAIDVRKAEEIERRNLQYEKNKKQQTFIHQKLVARNFSKNLLLNIKEQGLDTLESQGKFRDQRDTSMINHLLPWIFSEIQVEISKQKETELDTRVFHSDQIQQEFQRRQDIIDERQRILEEQARLRKEKKERLLRESRIQKIFQRIQKDLYQNIKNDQQTMEQILEYEKDNVSEQENQKFENLFNEIKELFFDEKQEKKPEEQADQEKPEEEPKTQENQQLQQQPEQPSEKQETLDSLKELFQNNKSICDFVFQIMFDLFEMDESFKLSDDQNQNLNLLLANYLFVYEEEKLEEENLEEKLEENQEAENQVDEKQQELKQQNQQQEQQP